MTPCDFERMGETDDYRCKRSECGRIVHDVHLLPIWAACAVSASDDAPPAVAQSRDCRHRGSESRRVECPTCSGTVRIKVFACSLKGECTLGQPVDGIPCCATCEEFEAAS